jgi:hypothetical protein
MAMPQQGAEKQDPLDQRSRGLNDEHPEGKANIENQKGQKEPPAPAQPVKKP